MDLTLKMPATTKRQVKMAERQDLGGLDAAGGRYTEAISEWRDFTRETFSRLYAPKNNRPLPPDRQSLWAGGAHRVLEQQAAFGELQVASHAHRAIAAEAAAELALSTGAMMGLGKMEQGEATANPDSVRSSMSALEEAGHGDEAESLEKDLLKAEGRRAASHQNLKDAVEKGMMATAMQGVVDKAKRMAKGVALLRGCGLGGPGGEVAGEIPDDLVRAIADDGLFAMIMDWLGRMQESSDALQTSTTREGHLDVLGVTPGDDPARLIGSELAKLRHPGLRRDLYRRLLEGEALCWEMAGEDESDKGDVVVLMDRSGSMGPQDMAYARALAVAAVARAFSEGRRATLVAFDHQTQVATAEPSGRGLEDVLRLARCEARGGTNISLAIAEGAKAAEKMEEADFLVITDGAFSAVDAEVAVTTTGLGASFLGVFVGGSQGGETGWLERKFCLRPGAGPGEAAAILEELA